MPALRKPLRVGVVLPELAVEGPDGAYVRETALLLWVALIEACQRHPGLAIYDPESTPLVPKDGHFAPQHAGQGATPTDAFYASTRRDELIWLELSLPKGGVVRLWSLGRDGKRQSFEGLGRNVGDQIDQVIGSWLSARQLPPLPRRFESATAEELLGTSRVLGPFLVEQARAWMAAAHGFSEEEAEARVVEDVPDVPVEPMTGDASALLDESETRGPDASFMDVDDTVPPSIVTAEISAPRLARPVANRLPPVLRVAGLRTLELAIREPLGDLILATDADHPRALFARYLAMKPHQRDFALLRRVIANAPCWGRALTELDAADDERDPDEPGSLLPTDLETVAGAGLAALCRPGHREVVELAAEHLCEDGRVDESVRLLERVVRLHPEEPRNHIGLLHVHRSTDRVGAWLESAQRSASLHGCPMDPQLPWYPDQIQIDLLVADALLNVGRLDEAIALRANRLEGRQSTWPRHTRILTNWRKDPRYVAWSYAREGWFRGDPARAIEGFGRAEPADPLDLAIFLDALVATGREDEVPLAWAQYGLGRGEGGAAARLAAARGLMVAGEWRRGLEELWRVELREPSRDEQVAIARIGRLASLMPIDIAEAALAERMAIGAHTLTRRLARTVADFVPGAAKSSIVARALGITGKTAPLEIDPSPLAAIPLEAKAKRAIDRMFTELRSDGDPVARADRFVERWFELAYVDASDESKSLVVRAAAYIAAQALGRYLAASVATPSPTCGALRTVAAEALALVHRYRDALADRDARAILATLDPLLRRVDRWVGTSWLAVVERSVGIDERTDGDVEGFSKDCATVAARILGPEEAAVLSTSIARLHRERADGWESAVAAQALRLAQHTGYVGVNEWSDAIVAQLASRMLDLDDALDSLHVACYLAEGKSAVPAVHAARILLEAGRAPAAVAVLVTGFAFSPSGRKAGGSKAWRARQLETFADAWGRTKPGVPREYDKVAAGMFEALQKGEPARAEKLGKWAIALDPDNAEAHRNLGLALAQQGKVVDALAHLVRGTREQATQILAGVLYQTGKLAEAMAVLDYASRWYARAEQWLTYGGIAYAAMDNARTVKAYALAYQLDPGAFDATQLNAYAGVLDEVGDYATCERIANHLLRSAAGDKQWITCAQNHLACAFIGQSKFDEAIAIAEQAVADNPNPDNRAPFAATLERARSRMHAPPPVAAPAVPPPKPREPAFALLDAGDFASAAAILGDASQPWRVRRVGLLASRFRFSSENDVDVTPRARAAANAVIADTTGTSDREAVLARLLALEIREAAYFPKDPVPRLGDRPTREAFYKEFRARGGVVLGDDAPPPAPFVDRVVVTGSKVSRASDYVALLRDLAALPPNDALAQFDLDAAGYLEVAKAWAAALEADPSLVAAIEAGLAKR